MISRLLLVLAIISTGMLFAQSSDSSEANRFGLSEKIKFSQLSDDAVLDIGGASSRKVVLAIPPTSSKSQLSSLANDYWQNFRKNLFLSNYFELLKAEVIPDLANISSSSTWDKFKTLGAKFLVLSRFESTNEKIIVNIDLIDLDKKEIQKNIVVVHSLTGKIARNMGQKSADELITAVTGKNGLSKSKILMSCGSRIKEIYQIDFDGKNVIRRTNDKNLALAPSWSSDNNQFLYTSYRPHKKGAAINPNLFVVNNVTKNRSLVAADRGINTGGKFHPQDKNKIIYTYSRNGRPEIYLINTSLRKRLKISRSRFFSVEPSWSPDGRKIVYSSSKSGKPNLYVVNSNGSGSKRLTFAGKYNSAPDWSPRGNKIAFSSQSSKRGNRFNIFTVNPSGSSLLALTKKGSNENPSWSPDGKMIAFSSNRDGGYAIYVMDEYGENIRRLSPQTLGQCKDPSWSN